MPQRLLRGILSFEGSPTREELADNYFGLLRYDLDWLDSADERVFHFIQSCIRRLEVPCADQALSHFTRLQDQEAIGRIEEVCRQPVHIRSNYQHLLEQRYDQQQGAKLGHLLHTATEILNRGLVLQDNGVRRHLQGVEASKGYLLQQLGGINRFPV